MRTLTFTSAAVAALGLSLAPSLAHARKSPLAGAPDVRDKYELRLARFEATPTFEATLSADYKNTYSGGLKLEYHLSDSLSIGGLIFFGASVDSSLAGSITDSLPNMTTPGDPTPTKDQFNDHLNTMPLHGGLGATFTPWFGKLALFGKSYLAFDLYLSGGFGFASLSSPTSGDACQRKGDGNDPITGKELFTDPRNDDPCNSGFRPGVQFGAGLHVFFNRWIALDLSFRNYMFKDNPSGQDFNADGYVDSSDPRFLSHLMFGVGVSFFLPPKAKITH
jgi:outer membrane beta-barrel protein